MHYSCVLHVCRGAPGAGERARILVAQLPPPVQGGTESLWGFQWYCAWVLTTCVEPGSERISSFLVKLLHLTSPLF